MCSEMFEGRSLELVDGDYVKSFKNLRCTQIPSKNFKNPTYRKTNRPRSFTSQKSQRSSFFENDNDTPLLVSSINGLSTKPKQPFLKPSLGFLGHDGCNNHFSLMTPSLPMTKVKSKINDVYSNKSPNSFKHLSMTPYSTLCKRINKASIKYGKIIPKKQNREIKNGKLNKINTETQSFATKSLQVNNLEKNNIVI